MADPGIARRIVTLARLSGRESVVEIGPGLGALTDLLAPAARSLWLIEVDSKLAAGLRVRYAPSPHVHIIEADVLTIDFESFLKRGESAVVVANLPYNIATAVLVSLLEHPRCFARLVLMLQREVVDRLRARPGSKAYSALSVFTQRAAALRAGIRVPPEAFVPRPKVDSEVVVIEPYSQPPVPIADPLLFTRIVRTVFTQRRKQLKNSLRAIVADPVEALRRAGIDASRRPETLTLAEFAALSDAANQHD